MAAVCRSLKQLNALGGASLNAASLAAIHLRIASPPSEIFQWSTNGTRSISASLPCVRRVASSFGDSVSRDSSVKVRLLKLPAIASVRRISRYRTTFSSCAALRVDRHRHLLSYAIKLTNVLLHLCSVYRPGTSQVPGARSYAMPWCQDRNLMMLRCGCERLRSSSTKLLYSLTGKRTKCERWMPWRNTSLAYRSTVSVVDAAVGEAGGAAAAAGAATTPATGVGLYNWPSKLMILAASISVVVAVCWKTNSKHSAMYGTRCRAAVCAIDAINDAASLTHRDAARIGAHECEYVRVQTLCHRHRLAGR